MQGSVVVTCSACCWGWVSDSNTLGLSCMRFLLLSAGQKTTKCGNPMRECSALGENSLRRPYRDTAGGSISANSDFAEFAKGM